MNRTIKANLTILAVNWIKHSILLLNVGLEKTHKNKAPATLSLIEIEIIPVNEALAFINWKFSIYSSKTPANEKHQAKNNKNHSNWHK